MENTKYAVATIGVGIYVGDGMNYQKAKLVADMRKQDMYYNPEQETYLIPYNSLEELNKLVDDKALFEKGIRV